MDRYKVMWNGHEIGSLSNVHTDMWALNGTWHTSGNELSIAFETALTTTDALSRLEDPAKTLKVVLLVEGLPDYKNYCLAMFMEEGKIGFRQVVAEAALDRFFPDR